MVVCAWTGIRSKFPKKYDACAPRIEYLPLVYFAFLFVNPVVLYYCTGAPVVVTYDVELRAANTLKLCGFDPSFSFVHDVVSSKLVAVRLTGLKVIYMQWDGSPWSFWGMTGALVGVIGGSAYFQSMAISNYYLRDNNMVVNGIGQHRATWGTSCFCRLICAILTLLNWICDLAVFGYWKEILLVDFFIRVQFAEIVWRNTEAKHVRTPMSTPGV